jgi:hypothetical protein
MSGRTVGVASDEITVGSCIGGRRFMRFAASVEDGAWSLVTGVKQGEQGFTRGISAGRRIVSQF